MGGSQSTEDLQRNAGASTTLPTGVAEKQAAAAANPNSSDKSQSQIAADALGLDPNNNSFLKGDGRYRVASKSSEKYFYESQPANQKGGVNDRNKSDGSGGSSSAGGGGGGALMSNLTVGAEAKKATEAAALIQKQVEESGGKVNVIDNSMSMDEIRRVLSESEGLNIGNKSRADLIQTWRFMLASDPIQYGFDAGFLTGGVAAAIALQWKKNRHPVKIASVWGAGFAAGMITFPVAMVFWEEYNMSRIVRNEKEMFQAQRDDYYQKEGLKKASTETK